MSEVIRYRLPFPPSVNTYWRRKGHLYFIGPPGKKFIRAVRLICAGAEKLSCRLSVELALTMPDHRERDIDNYVKGTLDALAKAGVFANDSQVDRLVVDRLPVRPPGACDVTITEIPSDGPVQTSLLAGFLQAEGSLIV